MQTTPQLPHTNTQLQINFDQKSIKYHEENPHVYEAFKKIVFKAMLKGYKRWSANGVFEVLRYRSAIRGNDEYKINNNYRAFYARLFIKDFPQHKDFFQTRGSQFDKIIC